MRRNPFREEICCMEKCGTMTTLVAGICLLAGVAYYFNNLETLESIKKRSKAIEEDIKKLKTPIFTAVEGQSSDEFINIIVKLKEEQNLEVAKLLKQEMDILSAKFYRAMFKESMYKLPKSEYKNLKVLYDGRIINVKSNNIMCDVLKTVPMTDNEIQFRKAVVEKCGGLIEETNVA